MNPKCILFIVVSIFLTLHANSFKNKIDYENLCFEHLGIDDGLPSLAIRKIIQDRDGFIWLASDQGFVRYEAYSPSFFERIWEQHQVAVITYRKNVKEHWEEE